MSGSPRRRRRRCTGAGWRLVSPHGPATPGGIPSQRRWWGGHHPAVVWSLISLFRISYWISQRVSKQIFSNSPALIQFLSVELVSRILTSLDITVGKYNFYQTVILFFIHQRSTCQEGEWCCPPDSGAPVLRHGQNSVLLNSKYPEPWQPWQPHHHLLEKPRPQPQLEGALKGDTKLVSKLH